jgi:hypothetical protein
LADDVGVAGVPVVGQVEPGRGGVGVADLHGFPGEPGQVFARVGAWPAGGVRARVFIIVLFCAWSSPELGRVIA